MKMTVVVLAGGEGRRIGGDKPQRLLGGQRLIDRAEVLARRWSNSPAVAVRHTEQAAATTLTVILDAPGLIGPLGAVAAALAFADEQGCDAVLTVPADMPFLPYNLAGRLEAEKRNAPVALAASGDHIHPVCALWSTDVLGTLPDYLATGRRSLKGLAEAVGCTLVNWPVEAFDPFFNINSAEDLARAEGLLALKNQMERTSTSDPA